MPNVNPATAAREVAVVMSMVTFVFLFLHDSWRADNPFLVPDLVLCGVLVAAALLPERYGVPALVFGFGLGAGVFGVSVSSYAARGEFGAASVGGLVIAVALALVLLRARPTAAA